VRDLFNQKLDLVLYDQASVYFQTEREDAVRRRGHSKDHRPDLPQAVVGLLLSGDGLPIDHERFAGNTYDGNRVPRVLDQLKKRFQLQWLIFVGDRGRVSQKNLEALDKAGYDWIVGVRLRNRPRLADALLSDHRSFRPVEPNLEVKEVRVEGIRYILCRNPEQAKRDAARRQAALDHLGRRLEASGVKGLVTRPGFRRFLRVDGESATVDLDKAEQDAGYDGLWVLDTSTDLPADEVALAYKSLWRVERAFRTLKSPMEMRPIRHWTEPRIRGHVVLCFLAFLVRTALERKIFEEAGLEATFDEILDALARVQQVRVDVKGIPLELTTEPPPLAQAVFRALGIRPPPRLRTLS
jgi:transposase